MNSLHESPQKFNLQGKSKSPKILSTIDLIDHMLGHHHDQALELVELARWHKEQAEALAADVTAALAEVEGLLR